MNSDQLEKYSELRTEKGHAYFRWLMLISTGMFSLTVNVLFGKTYGDCQLFVLKAALTANAVGILFGAIVVSGEMMIAKGAVRVLCDSVIEKMKGDTTISNPLLVYTLPPHMKRIEKLFYISLCISLILWICFIWLQ